MSARASAARLAGRYGGAWTEGIYEVLHDVQNELGLWCACEKPDCVRGPGAHTGRKGEYLEIDLMWFDRASGDYGVPVVAIEHENSYRPEDIAVDFWRVCQLAVPLRVCIGYAPDAARVPQLQRVLLGKASEWRRLPGGEDLLVLGHAEMKPDDYQAWCITGAPGLPSVAEM